MDHDGMLEALRKAGVVGTATGQPMHEKLAVPTPILLVNAVEGEPTYTVDTLLMERSAREIAEMMERLGDVGYRRVVLAVNDWTIEETDALIGRADDSGFEVAEISGDVRVEDEGALVRAALRRAVGDAATAGATVVNLETVLHMHRAVFKGRPMATKLVQMAGELETAAVYETPLGTLAADLAALAGAPEGFRAFTVGTAERIAGLDRADFSGARDAVAKTTDTIVVMDPEFPPEYALETMTPAKGIEDVADRIRRVRVPLDGATAASPAVRAGDRVRRGQVLARAPAGSPGVDIHAPFDGNVVVVHATNVEVERA